MTKTAIAAGFLVVLAGCGTRTFRTVQTAQNPDATRVWMVVQDSEGDQKVVHCDQAFLAAGSLCITWPTERPVSPASAASPAPHYAPPPPPPAKRAVPSTP